MKNKTLLAPDQRILQLEKELVTKNRELQIEAALEKVRARTISMQKSDELPEIAHVLFQQFKELGATPIQITIGIINEKEKVFDFSVTESGAAGRGIDRPFKGSFDEPALLKKLYGAWKEKKKSHTLELEGKELLGWVKYRNKLKGTEGNLPSLDEKKSVSAAFFSKGVITFSSNTHPSPETIQLSERFASAFDQTYTRFLDLQKAEEQAREAQIEVALERVRSRTMAMQKQNDLLGVLDLLVEQLVNLGVNLEVANFSNGIPGRDWDLWIEVVAGDGIIFNNYVHFPRIEHPYFHHVEKNIETFRKDGTDLFKDVFSKEEKDSWQDYINTQTIYKDLTSEEIKQFMYEKPGYAWSMVILKDTWVSICRFNTIPFSDEEDALLKRFANVFGQTYTRFLDLQKAEAQAREAQIEAALERIRAKTMAMHESAQLAETAKVFFEQFDLLGQMPDRMSIGIFKEESNELELWVTDQHGNQVNDKYFFSLDEPTSIAKIYKAWKNRKDICVVDLTGNDLEQWLEYVKEKAMLPIDETKIKGRRVQQTAFFSRGCLLFTTHEPVKEQTMRLLIRFAHVFDLTYTRFLDLQKAEAQAREAKIEAALEKVRGNAMAMHNSADLSSAASMVFTELRNLGINPIRCGVGLLNKESRKAQLYSATSSIGGDSLSLVGWVMLSEHPVLEKIYDSWLQSEDYFPELSGEQLKSYYKLLLRGLPVKVPEWQDPQKEYGHFLSFSVGCLYAWSDVPYNDSEIKILKRFATIIDLTFRRYMELQKAEGNAREAVKQAALDRVRAEIASMRTTGDLERITPVVWNELTTLGVHFMRCGVFIMDEQHQKVHTFLSTPEGKAIATLHVPFDFNLSLIANGVEHWRKGQVYQEYWDAPTFIKSWTALSALSETSTASPQNEHPPENLYLHQLPFLQGMLYVGSGAPLTEDELHLSQNLADAFSTAYARYEDFNKLEAAKKQVDVALNELQATQKQLIQSEKMASLGELTAGIAHEIQNPLNFVNNFSEVNRELILEMKEEIDKGNLDEVKTIAADIEENEEKINHHGKRADAIVKGMLQHSRASTGKKEPTDINALCDEYLRLSYHGLRAKDKSFNAAMNTHFDTKIGKINIIPQDIGRVLLNLFNNAFYAVTEKRKQVVNEEKSGISDLYQPIVSVSTKKSDNSIIITVSDNANGIPKDIVDKIFQPFFTTKPTGEGTGLGLSLSYDIVKAHGGEIKVESAEDAGTEFTIVLPI